MISLTAIGIISKILKYFRKNKKDLIFIGILFVLTAMIFILSIRITLRRREINRLTNRVEALEFTNTYLSDEILTYSNKLFIQKSFTNSSIKIVMITNDFYLGDEDIELREVFKYDFYK